MVAYSLTNRVYTPWGIQYKKFNWRESWRIFLNLRDKEVKNKTFRDTKPINHIIYWFDTNILCKINCEKKSTLDVRIRIVCGMINKISPNILSPDLKREFMECIWDSYKQFYQNYMNWYCHWIVGVPFQDIGL